MTTIRDIPTEVYLNQADGLPSECTVNLDNIQTVLKAKIGRLIAMLPSERMQEVKQAISFAIGFDSLS